MHCPVKSIHLTGNSFTIYTVHRKVISSSCCTRQRKWNRIEFERHHARTHLSELAPKRGVLLSNS